MLGNFSGGNHGVDARQTKAASALHAPKGGGRGKKRCRGENLRDLHRHSGVEGTTMVGLDSGGEDEQHQECLGCDFCDSRGCGNIKRRNARYLKRRRYSKFGFCAEVGSRVEVVGCGARFARKTLTASSRDWSISISVNR